MFVLQLELDVKHGEEKSLERDFLGAFTEAISVQEGFVSTALLHSVDGDAYLLSIAFAKQEQQQAWVTTELHVRVWAMLEAHFSGFRPKAYISV
jgi:heme-degrading monooxygenase HmoA